MAKAKSAAAAPAPAPASAGTAGATQPEATANGEGAPASNTSTDASAQAAPTVETTSVTDAVEAATVAPAAVVLPDAEEWPKKVRIYNHSHADLVCRVSGAYLPAAGFAETHLHDPEHAKSIADSLTNLAAANFIELSKLVIEPA